MPQYLFSWTYRDKANSTYLPINHTGDTDMETNTKPEQQLVDLPWDGGDGEVTEAIVLDEKEGAIVHRDIASIAATELDGITINRTRSKLDPFIDIRKERLVDRLSGAPSKSFGIWVPDPEADQGWKSMGTVSENYLLLTNKEVRQLALEIAEQSGLDYKESRIFWDGARFAHIIDFSGLEEEVTSQEAVGLSLITRTSYDKSWKYEAALMGKRFACDNGVLSGEFFARISFKHLQGGSEEEGWQDIVRQGLSVIEHSGENLQRFVQGLRLLKKQRMTDEQIRKVWKLYPKFGDALMGKIMSRYVAHEENTLYGLLNAGTNVFWHNQKLRASDFANNEVFASGLLKYAFEHLN